jgi:hypothetical protein
MFRQRVQALKRGEISFGYFKTYDSNPPEILKLFQNNVNNQFQIPVVFMISVLGLIVIERVSISSVLLGYAFIFSRIVHFYTHVYKNDVRVRAISYALGLLFVLLMWLTALV